jgi:hypothetical protein
MSDHVERDAQIRRFEDAKRLIMENLAIQRQLADQRLADTSDRRDRPAVAASALSDWCLQP